MQKLIFEAQRKFGCRRSTLKSGAGFTLMEIVVATTIFALVATAMMGLFNYTLKINRRTEALRQTTQGMRTFLEGLVKQIRNGQLYYGVTGSQPDAAYPADTTACPQVTAGTLHNAYYRNEENTLRILDTDGADICYYLADSNQTYVTPNVFSGKQLIMEKNVGGTYAKQTLNPPNFYIDKLKFIIRPTCDPYDIACGNPYSGLPKVQPMVSIFMKVRVLLPTQEQVIINYQTTVSSNKYDIPTQ